MDEASLANKDLYYVPVKLFLTRGNQLFIFKDAWNDWDLPGGRIRKPEFETPIEDIIERKVREELGDEVRYTLGRPVVTFRHERQEASAGGKVIRIFGVGYEATLEAGEPHLGDHHTDMKWVDVDTFEPKEYFTSGWLKGVEEYLELKIR